MAMLACPHHAWVMRACMLSEPWEGICRLKREAK